MGILWNEYDGNHWIMCYFTVFPNEYDGTSVGKPPWAFRKAISPSGWVAKLCMTSGSRWLHLQKKGAMHGKPCPMFKTVTLRWVWDIQGLLIKDVLSLCSVWQNCHRSNCVSASTGGVFQSLRFKSSRWASKGVRWVCVQLWVVIYPLTTARFRVLIWLCGYIVEYSWIPVEFGCEWSKGCIGHSNPLWFHLNLIEPRWNKGFEWQSVDFHEHWMCERFDKFMSWLDFEGNRFISTGWFRQKTHSCVFFFDWNNL